MTRALWVTTLVALSGLLAPSAMARDLSRDYHETFDVTRGATLHVSHGDGDLDVIAWDEDRIDVEIHYRARLTRFGAGKGPTFDVEFRVDGQDIHVTEHRFGGAGALFTAIRQQEYSVTIHAPVYVNLHLEGDDGSVVVTGWEGAITCRQDDADVTLDDVQGPVEIYAEDGEVAVAGVSGDLEIEVDDARVEVRGSTLSWLRLSGQDGRLRVRDCEVESAEIEADDATVVLADVTVSRLDVRGEDGRLDLELSGTNVDWDIETDDGDVLVELRAPVDATVSVRRDDGDLDWEIPDARFIDESRRRFRAELGDGSGRIDVETNDGDVTFRES